MNDTNDDIPTIHQPPTRHAAEWGFASLFLGGILALLAMMTLQINLQLFVSPPMWAREDLKAIQYASFAGVFVVLGLNFAAGVFGVGSLLSASKQRQPCALGLSGVFLNILTFLLWVFAFIDLFAVLDMLLRRQGHGGIF